MKRSEMIKIIQASFIEHMNCMTCCKTDDELYSKVLKAIEDAGMLPPCNPPIGSGDFECEHCGGCCAFHTHDCEWSKE